MVEFVDRLPAARRSDTSPLRYDYSREAMEMKKKPYVWAKFPRELNDSQRNNVATGVRRDDYKDFPSKEFQVAVRNGVLYIRYNPTRGES